MIDHLEQNNFKTIDLTSIHVSNPGVYDTNLDSFLDYIHRKGWNNNEKPHFVTNKNLLKSVAASKTNLIYACRMKGVTFMIIGGTNTPVSLGLGPVFEHIMTEKSNDEIEIKGVFEATVPREGGDSFRIYYSGQIDAVTKDEGDNIRHFELKLFENTKSGDEVFWDKVFWKNSGCIFYWQAFFGNCESLIFGFRTGKHRWNRIDPYHLYKITEMNVQDMPKKAAVKLENETWTVEDGEKNLLSLLTLVNKFVTSDKDCFVFEKNEIYSSGWIAKRDKKKIVSKFQSVIREKLCTVTRPSKFQ
ncbi:hypothetical protein GCK72_020415 [Caenorhabditis remanei]|uniref:Decapping nuclease n=1 Tax=Caenorhabditis remanei TaxID=31234 RepID=A0A6A5GF82_CAERE|nr:hypothetical protein GCK72_020415 [Caenorhabditis remanei]KAF1753858.1 hypothetical protein GCK72_020415 [Caenorhabditis remanei]